ncbi:hypothetical protein ACWDKQ_34655 [Saccharopolyspora sp. NPDC000995]
MTAPEDDGGAVDDGVLVVPGRESSPLLDAAVAAFDHVAIPVVGGVERDRAAARDPRRLR